MKPIEAWAVTCGEWDYERSKKERRDVYTHTCHLFGTQEEALRFVNSDPDVRDISAPIELCERRLLDEALAKIERLTRTGIENLIFERDEARREAEYWRGNAVTADMEDMPENIRLPWESK